LTVVALALNGVASTIGRVERIGLGVGWEGRRSHRAGGGASVVLVSSKARVKIVGREISTARVHHSVAVIVIESVHGVKSSRGRGDALESSSGVTTSGIAMVAVDYETSGVRSRGMVSTAVIGICATARQGGWEHIGRVASFVSHPLHALVNAGRVVHWGIGQAGIDVVAHRHTNLQDESAVVGAICHRWWDGGGANHSKSNKQKSRHHRPR
jgi:hypothetical protein